MFGNQSRDYSGHDVGLCHCDACKTKFRVMFHRELPTSRTTTIGDSCLCRSREVGREIGELIRSKRPGTGYFQLHPGVHGRHYVGIEYRNRPASTALAYSASDNVNRARNSQPTKMSINLCMQFVDYAWRFATVSRQEIALRLWENVANGGALAFEVNGTLDQQESAGCRNGKAIFQWLAANENYYASRKAPPVYSCSTRSSQTGRNSDQESYRGVFRLLTERSHSLRRLE